MSSRVKVEKSVTFYSCLRHPSNVKPILGQYDMNDWKTAYTHIFSLSLSLLHKHSLALSLSLSHTHTYTHIHTHWHIITLHCTQPHTHFSDCFSPFFFLLFLLISRSLCLSLSLSVSLCLSMSLSVSLSICLSLSTLFLYPTFS